MASRPQQQIERIIDAINARWPELIDGTVEAVFDQVPAYAHSTDPALRDDLAVHVGAVFRVLLICLREDRLATRADFPSTQQQAHRRVEQGVLLSDFLQAFRIGQLHIWNGILEAVGDDRRGQQLALRMVDKVMHVIEVGSTVAAEGYLEAQQHKVADQDRRVRDLIEDLLRRDEIVTAGKQAMLRSAGLEPGAPLIVMSATSSSLVSDERKFRLALTAVRAGRASGVEGLAATRRDEIIGMMPVAKGDADATLTRLARAFGELGRNGLPMSVGVSTVRSGLSEAPEAYAEAVAAREALVGRAGVLALPWLSTFDYLVLRRDETARRLLRPEVRQFVEEDLARGGALVATLEEYVACDLNAKTVAERLHMHVNTVYYRLARISERTGGDLRSFGDVLELVIAMRLLREHPNEKLLRQASQSLS